MGRIKYLSWIFWALSGFVLLGNPGWGDSVRFRETGQILQGQLIGIKGSQILFKTLQGTQIPISREAVSEIHLGKEVPTKPATWTPSQPVTPPATPKPAAGWAPFSEGGPGNHSVKVLSRFKGQTSQNTYAGLYHLNNRGTFWVQLPESATPTELRFVLYGKQNTQQPLEKFSLSARYLDAQGREIHRSPSVDFDYLEAGVLEWFQLLDKVAGVAGQKEVVWRVPQRTASVEFRAQTREKDKQPHLVGYLGNLTVTPVPR